MGADGIILAVVGSRKFNDYAKFMEIMNEHIDTTKVKSIISGGAAGVDKMAESYAFDTGIPIKVVKPDYKKYADKPKFAPIARNRIIAETCDAMIAFYYDDSNGTKDAMNHAIKCGKNVFKINLEEI